MTQETYTLSEAFETIDLLTAEITTLLAVAVDDMKDVYGDESIPRELFNSSETGLIQSTPIARKFARLLIERLIFSPEVTITYTKEEEPNDLPSTDA